MPDQPAKEKFSLKTFWSKTSGKVIVVSGFIAAVTTIFTSFGSVLNLFRSAKSKGVQIVDITIANDTIDLKLRNNGSEVAFLKRVRLDVKRSWKIIPDTSSNFIKVDAAAVYQLNIDSKKPAPYAIEVPVSQSIKPNETDRFQLSLYSNINDSRGDNEAGVYLADLEIFMNENNASVKQKDILFAFELPMQHYEKMRPENIRSVNEINAIKGYKSPVLTALLSRIRLK